MIVSCKCLNIQVETKDEPVKFDKGSLGGDFNNHFFSKDLLCSEVLLITKRHDFLIREERVYGWTTYECLNCDLVCYADHANKEISTILISPELLTDPKQIHELTKSDCFSQTYDIYINLTNDSSQIYSPRSSALLPPKIKALQRQMSEKIESETKRTEKKIRKFTENQYSALDEFRTKAQNDYHALSKIIYEKDKLPKTEYLPARSNSNKTSSLIQSLPKPTITTLKNNPTMNLMDFTFKPYTKGNENVSSETSLIKTPLVGGSNDSGLPPASYDTEGLFSLEGMDDLQIGGASDDDLSESEGESGSHDEGIYIPHHKPIEIAMSLPVNVPKFIIHNGSIPTEINPLITVGREPDSKTDIAASIRALAKSVHGDRIFGELPRPRLGSQI